MREIKFKARRADNGEWIEGYYVLLTERDYDRRGQLTGERRVPHIFKDRQNEDSHGYWYKIDPRTLCQYTGEKDSAGNDIYEWDLLECVCPNGKTLRGYVEYSLGQFTLDYNDVFNLGYLVADRSQTIVGNKFDKMQGGKWKK